jgi:transposase
MHAASASAREVTLVEAILAASFLGEEPERLVGDRAYDSDPLDAARQERGIQMIAPHRRYGKKPKTQDGRKLRRWKIERPFAWLHNFRRLELPAGGIWFYACAGCGLEAFGVTLEDARRVFR